MNQPLRLWISRLWSALVVFGLFALAYWGHRTHWKIPPFQSLVDGTPPSLKEKPASSPKSTRTDFPVVEFESPEAVHQVGIEYEIAQERNLELIVAANATVSYDQTKAAELSARVAGLVWQTSARQGQFVRKGELLALVDSPEVGQTRTDFLQEHSSHHYAVKRLERLQVFAKQGAVSAANLREAEVALWEARSRRFSAQQKLLNLGLDIDLAVVEKEPPEVLARHIQLLGLCDKVISRLQPVPKTANLIPMFAPLDGVITQYDLVVGERITPERHRIEIVDVRTMWIRLAIRKEDSPRLALGQEVQYASTIPGKSVTARLDWISTSLNEKTRTLEARASVSNPALLGTAKNSEQGPWLLQANEYGNTRVKVGAIAQAVMVPVKAVQRLDGQTLIFVARPDRKSFEPRKVEIGESHEDWVHIHSGVSRGEIVATTNSFVLKSELMKDSLEAQ